MLRVCRFGPDFARLLPAAHELLLAGGLTVHDGVARITLHGSRGLAGELRADSDVDLTLLVDGLRLPTGAGQEGYLRDLLEVTLAHWHGAAELDLAAVFDLRDCGLRCFDRTRYDEAACAVGGVDCFGLFKIQKGFNGYVPAIGVQVRLMYPCLTIWRRAQT